MHFLLFYYYLLHSCQKAELCLSGWWDQSVCCWETFKGVYKILVESLRKIPAAAKYSWNVERVNTFMETKPRDEVGFDEITSGPFTTVYTLPKFQPWERCFGWTVCPFLTLGHGQWNNVKHGLCVCVCVRGGIRSTTQYKREQHLINSYYQSLRFLPENLLEPATVIANQDGIQFNNAQSELAPLSVQN